MAQLFKVDTVQLTKQLVRASGANSMLYVNGIEVTAGVSGSLIQTGVQLGNTIIQTGNAAVTHANGIGVNLSGNLTQTGVALGSKIDSLSGFVGNVSGGLEVRIAATGNSAVVHANGMGSILSGNLTLTGQTLQGRINSLSGFVGNVSGGLETRITQTGNAAVAHANGIGTNLSGNLALTGSNLYALITGASGQLTGDYATKTQLTQTGVTLGAKIDSLSGFVGNVSGGLEVRITATGNSAVAHANGIGQIISGNLTLTGQTLQGRITSLSGFVGNVSGGLETRIFQTGNAAVVHANGIGAIISGNLTQTGTTLQGRINSLSGFVGNASGGLEVRVIQTGTAAVSHANGIGSILSGNITQTGLQLEAQVDSLSGLVETRFVHRTGVELVSGAKTFVSPIKVGTNAGVATGFFGNGGWRDNAAGNLDSLYLGVSPYFPAAVYDTNDLGLVYSASGSDTTPSKVGLVLYNNDTGYSGWAPMLVFAKAEAGASSYKSALAAIAANTISGSATSVDWIDGNLTFYVARWGGSGLTPYMRLNSSGYVGIGLDPNPLTPLHVSGGFVRSEVGYQSGTFNLADILYPRSNPSGFITGLAGTGSLVSIAYVNGMGTILSGNLTTTGATLDSKINALSGYGNGFLVHRTGDELISGIKQFNYSDLRPNVIIGSGTEAVCEISRSGVLVRQILLGGGAIVMNTHNTKLYSYPDGMESISWSNRSLHASNGAQAVQWGGRLLSTDAATHTLDWGNKRLSGVWEVSSWNSNSGSLVNYFRLSGASGALQAQIPSSLETIVYKTGEQYITGNKWFLGNTHSQSGQYETSSTVSANYTVKDTDGRVYCDNTSLITLTFGSAVTNSGQMVKLKLINTGTAILTGTAGQKFDGSDSYVLNGQYNAYQVHSNGANWYLW